MVVVPWHRCLLRRCITKLVAYNGCLKNSMRVYQTILKLFIWKKWFQFWRRYFKVTDGSVMVLLNNILSFPVTTWHTWCVIQKRTDLRQINCIFDNAPAGFASNVIYQQVLCWPIWPSLAALIFQATFWLSFHIDAHSTSIQGSTFIKFSVKNCILKTRITSQNHAYHTTNAKSQRKKC